MRVGNTIARTLAARGYRIIVHANASLAQAEQTAHEIEATGTEALRWPPMCVMSNAVRQLVEQAQARFGRIDALVNTAAVWHRKPLEQTTVVDVKQHFEINTQGRSFCCPHVGLLMTRQGQRRSDRQPWRLGSHSFVRIWDYEPAYFAGKGAIETLTRTMAIELAVPNPACCGDAILPGPVMLPADLPEEERKASIAGTLVHLRGRPEHVAHAVVFLLENDFVTGVCLPVDGGRSICSDTLAEGIKLDHEDDAAQRRRAGLHRLLGGSSMGLPS